MGSIGVWFNVNVFDRYPRLDRIRNFMDYYFLFELEWRMEHLCRAIPWWSDNLNHCYLRQPHEVFNDQ